MPTRSGWTVLVGALAALTIGRLFGILELFVVSAAMVIAVGAALFSVRLVRPDLRVSRWVHPTMLTVGSLGRTDLLIANGSRLPSPRCDLIEPVGDETTAALSVGSIRGGSEVTARYRLPATRRGVLTIGPTVVERTDVLGLATARRVVAAAEDVIVAPVTVDLMMPSLGSGALGRHLLSLSQRLGPGEFHSLRDYVEGDEPRSIHWKASARSDTLKVRQHEAQGVRRFTVVLDIDADGYGRGNTDDDEAFERAVSIAASIVLAGDRSGLSTRFVAGDIDIRGPEVAAASLRALSTIQPDAAPPGIGRDPGDGLGVAFIITGSPASAVWQTAFGDRDPTMTRVGVFTSGGASGPLQLDAPSLEQFATRWHRHIGGSVTPPVPDTGTDRSEAPG